ncbi:hypothetical protein [uncultured Helicobacter sp.]|uniref:hypothetical protein n=1 Tax=uncultured Helicobacter sp. TaxID=175537 RepID=UPI00375206F7
MQTQTENFRQAFKHALRAFARQSDTLANGGASVQEVQEWFNEALRGMDALCVCCESW